MRSLFLGVDCYAMASGQIAADSITSSARVRSVSGFERSIEDLYDLARARVDQDHIVVPTEMLCSPRRSARASLREPCNLGNLAGQVTPA